MIHQLIFAGPKPGLSAEAYQNYWVNFHAVDHAIEEFGPTHPIVLLLKQRDPVPD